MKNKLKKIGYEEDSKSVSYREGGNIKWGDFKTNNNYDNEPNQRIWMLVNKDEIFLKMLKNKKIRKIINDVLGSDYILSSHGANIIGPGIFLWICMLINGGCLYPSFLIQAIHL